MFFGDQNNLGRAKHAKSRGQALVEFALVLPVLILVLFGTIEISLLMNTYVNLKNLARSLAKISIKPDMTLSRSPEYIRDQAKKIFRKTATLRFMTSSDHFQRHPEDFLSVNVNHKIEGRWFTEIRIRYTVDATLLPRTAFGKSVGSWPIVVHCALPNETQGKRQNAQGAYEQKTFFLSSFADSFTSTPSNKGGTP